MREHISAIILSIHIQILRLLVPVPCMEYVSEGNSTDRSQPCPGRGKIGVVSTLLILNPANVP